MTPPPSETIDTVADRPLSASFEETSSQIGLFLILLLLTIGGIYVAGELTSDLSDVRASSVWPFVLLGCALLIALGFEFVNGFHDTANAVATVIYTYSMPAHVAVAWSGIWNFIGVMLASGAVAFGIVALLPVELILQVSAGAGFAMVFALLIAAIIWNLGTWYLGLPSSSSHALIGSVIGVGIANQLMAAGGTNTSGVDWGQALNVGKSLLFSPLIGFSAAAFLLLIAMKAIPIDKLYRPPRGKTPPPLWIRGLLILTCTGVSFAHGSNDGQKGMGLIMLILIGTVPTVYALNRTVDVSYAPAFVEASTKTEAVFQRYAKSSMPPADPRKTAAEYIRTHEVRPDTLPALRALSGMVRTQIASYATVAQIPTEQTSNVRNDMYLLGESLRWMDNTREPAFTRADRDILLHYKSMLDNATKYIPVWVKAAVAIALGLGTMIGWKRIVVTVGEKIGKTHLSYGQGASAELVAMTTIGAADLFGLPVSTTQVLSSGVAGTMAANRSGLQWQTVRSLALAWVMTLPASILLSGTLFWLFRHFA
ncbi:MAG: inorganic phosphate transporter [Nitrospira sp.]|nr:inorganic phosphate transporter [Nitrospira sp.]